MCRGNNLSEIINGSVMRTSPLILFTVIIALTLLQIPSIVLSPEPADRIDQSGQDSYRDGLTIVQIAALDALSTTARVGGQSDNTTSYAWVWAVKAGGTSPCGEYQDCNDVGEGIAVDSSGNAYVTGTFRDTATFGDTNLTSRGYSDIFVAKLSSSGSWLWAESAGGSSSDHIQGIAVDSSGNAYITGFFEDTVSFGDSSLTSGGSYDVFVVKISSSGSWLWAESAGGSSYDHGRGIAVVSSGNAYITGSFYGTASFGSTSLTSGDNGDVFVAKLSGNGSWSWAVKAEGNAGGGDGQSGGTGIAVDSSGNAYVTGTFSDTATFGDTNLMSRGYSDIFVGKVNGQTGSWLWAESAGGAGSDDIREIAVDPSGNPYVTGRFNDKVTFGDTNLTSGGGWDIFVAKLSSSGSWSWAVKAGGTDRDEGFGIAVDSSGNAYVTGTFSDTATFGSTNLMSSGSRDIFVAKLSSSGSWSWAVKAGGTEWDEGFGIAVDSSGNPHVTGRFNDKVTFGDTNLTSGGGWDIFVTGVSESDGDGISDSADGDSEDDEESTEQDVDVDVDEGLPGFGIGLTIVSLFVALSFRSRACGRN